MALNVINAKVRAGFDLTSYSDMIKTISGTITPFIITPFYED